MAINLTKAVTKATSAVKTKTRTVGDKLTEPTNSIAEFTKNLDAWTKETRKNVDECAQKNEKARATKKKKQTSGSHKVQARPARPLTARAVARMAEKVMQQSPCGSIEYGVVVAVASRIVNITDWVQLIINILQDCVDIYELCYSYSDFTSEVNEVDTWITALDELPFIGGTFITDIFVWLLELLQTILLLPRKVVLFFKPLNDFLKVLIQLLTMFKDEINRFIAAW
jgi:hypothetical protein